MMKCDHLDPDEGRCALAAGHDGPHWHTMANIVYRHGPEGETAHFAALPPHSVEPRDEVIYTRTVEISWARGEGPILEQSLREARVTLLRLVYTYDFRSRVWTCEIGPVHGHVFDDAGRLGARPRALKPRDHHPSGWPAWLLGLGLQHQPHTTLQIQEKRP